MTMTVTLREPVASRLESAASAHGTSPESLVETVLLAYLDEEANRKIDREAEAYRAMHADLLNTHPGEYVALHQGQLVDHDQDQLALYLRVKAQYPKIPVLIRQVRPEVEEVFTIRSPRLEHD